MIVNNDVLRCCPQCSSPAVDFGALASSEANCAACKWSGSEEALLVVPIGAHGLDVSYVVNDIRSLMSKELGLPILKLLLKWGFVTLEDLNDISGTLDRKVFSKYLASISAAIVKAILETSRAIAAEGVTDGKRD